MEIAMQANGALNAVLVSPDLAYRLRWRRRNMGLRSRSCTSRPV